MVAEELMDVLREPRPFSHFARIELLNGRVVNFKSVLSTAKYKVQYHVRGAGYNTSLERECDGAVHFGAQTFQNQFFVVTIDACHVIL